MSRATRVLRLAARPVRRLRSLPVRPMLADWAVTLVSMAVDVPPELLKLSRAERAVGLEMLKSDIRAPIESIVRRLPNRLP